MTPAGFGTYESWSTARTSERLTGLGLPLRWQRRLLGRWQRLHKIDRPASERFLLKAAADLAQTRIPLDASDDTICGTAQALALRCMDLGLLYQAPVALRERMELTVRSYGIEPPPMGMGHGPALARMTCSIWWRRRLRRHHAQTVESSAIALGYVSRRGEIYCSNEALRIHLQQAERNAASLESIKARNELGQEYALAELAAKGTSNKAIRRAELMTRISGFERIAKDMGHSGLFMTITCPSRMHRWRTVGPEHARQVVENGRYDGTTPRQAQKYLAKVFARIRAKMKRKGVAIYGFRIAEPNHDGTPHWHLLVFHEPACAEDLREIVLEHALKDSPNEPGAQEHRVDFVAIDWEKGGAAAYIAKYVAKNIDGYRVERDLFDVPAIESAARVEAWARTWGIRQFQQVGGPPVGPWRELRRVEALPAGAPAHLVKAHNAVNKVAVIEGRENACVAWDHYCQAQGGVFCGRKYLIRVTLDVAVERVGRYGDAAAPRPVGVETSAVEVWTPPWMAHMDPPALIPRRVEWFVESTRHEWVIVGRAAPHGGGQFNASAQPAPWTCVNNCTEGGSDGAGNGVGYGQKSMGERPDAHQSHGRALHGASVGGAGAVGGPPGEAGAGSCDGLRRGQH